MECDCNMGGLKCPLRAINQEMDNSKLRYPLRCHGMVELDDHSEVEEPTWGHKRFQGVSLHKPHRISELGIGSKGWKIIICIAVHFPGTTIGIAYNGATMEERSPDNRSREHIMG